MLISTERAPCVARLCPTVHDVNNTVCSILDQGPVRQFERGIHHICEFDSCANTSGNQYDMPCRFEWAPLAPLTFAPSVGHLSAGAVKDITVTYTSEKPLQLKAAAATLKAAQLKLPTGMEASDWDNRAAAGGPAAPEPKIELANAKEAPPVALPLKVRITCAVGMPQHNNHSPLCVAAFYVQPHLHARSTLQQHSAEPEVQSTLCSGSVGCSHPCL